MSFSETVGVSQACLWLGVARSQYYRRQQPKAEACTPSRSRRALGEQEKTQVRDLLNSERFCDASPRQVYATLLDEGHYVCHWRTMYRILNEHKEVRERRNQRRHPSYKKPELLARGPNELWSWDITKLRGPQKWTYYYLYVIMDVFSRYAVGWMIAPQESSTLAKELIETTCVRQSIARDELVIHSDRGPLGDVPSPNDLEDGGPTLGRPGRGEIAFSTPCLERQSVFGGAVQDHEISTGLSGSFWCDRGCQAVGASVFPVVQPRAPSHGFGLDATFGGALWTG